MCVENLVMVHNEVMLQKHCIALHNSVVKSSPSPQIIMKSKRDSQSEGKLSMWETIASGLDRCSETTGGLMMKPGKK